MVGEVEDTASSPSRPRREVQNVTLVNGHKGHEEPETDTDTTEEEGSGSSQASIEPLSQPLRDRFMWLQSAAEDASLEERERAALQAAEREGLHLILAPRTKSGYKGVHLKPSKSKPYQTTACGNRKNQHLGRFATAAEAALCYARHIGRDAAAAAAEKQEASPPEPTSQAAKQAVATAAEEGLELVRVPSANSGYKGVIYLPYRSKPFQARASSGGGRSEHLGLFDNVEEAALCYARHERRAAAIAALCDTGLGLGLGEGKASRSHIHKLAKVSPSARDSCYSVMSATEALEQAKAQGLHLLRACTRSGYRGVTHNATSKSRPYVAKISAVARQASSSSSTSATASSSATRSLHLGCFATAEEAALRCARHLKDHALPPATHSPPTGRSSPLGASSLATPVPPTSYSLNHHAALEHARSHGHRRSRDEAFETQGDASRFVRPRAAHAVTQATAPEPQLQPEPQPQPQAAAVSHAPYMLPMMIPGLHGMYGIPGMPAGGVAATRPVGAGLGAGLPPGSAMLPHGAPLPSPGGLPGMHMPYSGMVPMMLRGAMPSAGMVPQMASQMTSQMAHWPMMQGVPGAQPTPRAAGTPPGAVQAAVRCARGWYGGYDPALVTMAS